MTQERERLALRSERSSWRSNRSQSAASGELASGKPSRPSVLRLTPEQTPVQPRASRLLELLADDDAALLKPSLEPVELEVGRVLHTPGQPVRHVYFVESGLVSIIGANRERRRMEVGMVGFEGLTGIEVILGGDLAAHEALVQSAGSALRLTPAALREAMARSASLREVLLRFVHVFLVQSSHAAIAAGRARIDERLARGLLMWQDRLRRSEWMVTHEFLALLMGVRRQGVTVALHELEGKGFIRSVRNRVRLFDRAGLERTANGFYGAPEDEYRRLFPEPPDLRRQA
jgi:CRP-like cAMP-binding protein